MEKLSDSKSIPYGMPLLVCQLFNEGALELVNKMLGWHDRKIRLGVLKKQHMESVMPHRLSGGSIRVESKLGEGTTFVVSLPHKAS